MRGYFKRIFGRNSTDPEPSHVALIIESFVDSDFSIVKDGGFADFFGGEADDFGLSILKSYVAWMYLGLNDGEVNGWETEAGEKILRNLARELRGNKNYNFVINYLSNSILSKS